MREEEVQRRRVLKSKGGYQGIGSPSEVGPPPRTPSGTADPVPTPPKRKKRRAA